VNISKVLKFEKNGIVVFWAYIYDSNTNVMCYYNIQNFVKKFYRLFVNIKINYICYLCFPWIIIGHGGSGEEKHDVI